MFNIKFGASVVRAASSCGSVSATLKTTYLPRALVFVSIENFFRKEFQCQQTKQRESGQETSFANYRKYPDLAGIFNKLSQLRSLFAQGMSTGIFKPKFFLVPSGRK
jgi:hypothetical protein